MYRYWWWAVATRAAHLEPAYCLSTDSFIQATLRFTPRRVNSHLTVPDNGRSFIGASCKNEPIRPPENWRPITERDHRMEVSWYPSHFGEHGNDLYNPQNKIFPHTLALKCCITKYFTPFDTCWRNPQRPASDLLLKKWPSLATKYSKHFPCR